MDRNALDAPAFVSRVASNFALRLDLTDMRPNLGRNGDSPIAWNALATVGELQ